MTIHHTDDGDDFLTAIDFKKTLADVHNFHDLPPAAKDVFLDCDHFESRGFQELLGYRDRRVVWVCGGHWIEGPQVGQELFHITSMGNGEQLFVE